MDDTIGDVSKLIQTQRPLAYCAAFVAARFAPGYTVLRRGMVSEINEILKLKHCSPSNQHEKLWLVIRASAILYCYSVIQPASDDVCSSDELGVWALKSTLEMVASRLALHRSAEELRSILDSGNEMVIDSSAFRRYIFWLWLYTMSHHSSLLQRIPPTVRVDINIRSAPSLLQSLDLDRRVLRILAEVELCLLWSRAEMHDQDLGEWWCSPETPPQIEVTFAALEGVEVALTDWQKRWLPGVRSDGPNKDEHSSITFHFRFTRFCLSSYAARLIFQGDHGLDQMLSAQTMTARSRAVMELILRSLNAAEDCCTMLIKLSPLQQERVRYLPDGGFALAALPCFYLVSAAHLFANTAIPMHTYLKQVQRLAEIMKAMAMDENSSSAIFAREIVMRLKAKATRGTDSDSSLRVLWPDVVRESHDKTSATQGGNDLVQPGTHDPQAYRAAFPTEFQVSVADNDSWDISYRQYGYDIASDWFFEDAHLEAVFDH